jgi:hypothetical protein
MLKLLHQRKQAKLQWLQDPSEMRLMGISEIKDGISERQN